MLPHRDTENKRARRFDADPAVPQHGQDRAGRTGSPPLLTPTNTKGWYGTLAFGQGLKFLWPSLPNMPDGHGPELGSTGQVSRRRDLFLVGIFQGVWLSELQSSNLMI